MVLRKINSGNGACLVRPTVLRGRYPARKLHLIDIEYLADTALPNCDLVRWVRELYGRRPGIGAADHVVIACSHSTLLNATLGWPRARYLVRSGPNGTDLALLDVIRHENITVRFTHVVIGSGDGAFAAAAASLTAADTTVTVVSRRQSLSNRLRIAATEVVFIDDTEQPSSAALRHSSADAA
jgi:hypothetical protein